MTARSTCRPVAAVILATWFWVGRMPFAPGTWGSLAALPLALVLHAWAGTTGVLGGAVVVFLTGWWAADRYVDGECDDPKEVVIDEVAGQLLCLSVVAPGLPGYAIGFVLFRVFDIAKPWPVGWCDRNVKGAFGVMLDDIAAAVYGAAVLMLVKSIWVFS